MSEPAEDLGDRPRITWLDTILSLIWSFLGIKQKNVITVASDKTLWERNLKNLPYDWQKT